jgi:sporulation protein YlmC with PRC-barrel domain
MKKLSQLLFVFSVVGLPCIGTAWAQSTASDQSGQSYTNPSQNSQNISGQKQRSEFRASEGRVERITELKGKSVTNWRNEDLGKITDFVIDKRQGRVNYAVLSYGSKRFAIPWQALSLSPDEKSFILDMPEEKFKNGPGFGDNWPAHVDTSLMGGTWHPQSQSSNQYSPQEQSSAGGQSSAQSYGIYRSYDTSEDGSYRGYQDQSWRWAAVTQNSGAGQDNMSQSQSQGGQSWGSQSGTSSSRWGSSRNDLTSQYPWLERSSQIIGQDVVNANDETLGDVQDLAIDMREGRIAYLILAHGGALGMGEKLVPVPWNVVQINSQRNEIVLNDSKNQISSAPSFTKSTWPDLSNQQLGSKIAAYFGTRPYWQVYGYPQYYGQQMQQPRDTGAGWDANSSYSKQFNPVAMLTITGQIINVSTFRPEHNAELGYRVKVKTDDGKTVHVHLGPVSQLSSQGMEIKEGDRVTITGSYTKIWGREILMACSIEDNGKTVQLRTAEGHPCTPTQGQSGTEGTQSGTSQSSQGNMGSSMGNSGTNAAGAGAAGAAGTSTGAAATQGGTTQSSSGSTTGTSPTATDTNKSSSGATSAYDANQPSK